MFDLTGKTALLTGSSKGIGKAIAEAMSEQGANVIISSRKGDVCDEVAAAINAKGGGKALAIPCNISHKEQLQELVDKTKSEFGDIHILVCNAAVNPFFGSLSDIPDSAFDKIMHCNIQSNLWLCQMVLPEMRERKDGSIIIVSSVGAYRGSTQLGAYAISKGADIQLIRCLAQEEGPNNIRVNGIAPGLIKTNFARALWEDPERAKKVEASYPLRRLGESEDIAGTGVLLASKEGSYITGETIIIDGGGMA
ncbi:MAG: SDR family oxidoreductase [Candidatus Hydrogenedentes bacterium]|jgi:NAD(P)-dependent dehydrogenase (short-subunit alcohol dehydrogenase family)|nr:SDR family oxidoreductase [Candidatus Hydrogenedentota bacterium]